MTVSLHGSGAAGLGGSVLIPSSALRGGSFLKAVRRFHEHSLSGFVLEGVRSNVFDFMSMQF